MHLNFRTRFLSLKSSMLFLLFVLSAQHCSSKDNPMEHGIRSALFLATVFVEKEDCTDIK